ncbi:MAG TPA: 50S ribosomal protein L22 [Methanomicrobia archaeon]|nr:MAG: 50S ribosomal protein L22 [archaeon]HHN81063.1 50S ribosomal protein L22 [Methanomicrobia archaeon]
MAAYSYTKDLDETRTAKVYGKDLRISPKHAVELARELKGKKLDTARQYLEDVIAKKRAVPFRKYNKKVGHKRGLVGWDAGRYPVKASKEYLKLLHQLQANAEYKGLEADKLRIIHASSYKSREIPGFLPRAYGRGTPFNQELTNIEMIVEER